MPRVKLDLPERFAFSTEIVARITDVNYGGHVGNDAMLGMVHEARVRFFASHGFTELDVDGVGIILTDAVLVYKAEAFAGDVLVADVTAADPERRGCDLYYRIRRKDDADTHVLHAKTSLCFFDYATRRVAAMPDAFRPVFDA